MIYPLLAWGIHYMLFGKILVNPAKLWVPILAMIMVGLFVRGLFALVMPTAYARFFRLPRTNQPDMLIALLRFIASGLLMAFAIAAYHIPYNEPLLIAWQGFVILALVSQFKYMSKISALFFFASKAIRRVFVTFPYSYALWCEEASHYPEIKEDNRVARIRATEELFGW